MVVISNIKRPSVISNSRRKKNQKNVAIIGEGGKKQPLHQVLALFSHSPLYANQNSMLL